MTPTPPKLTADQRVAAGARAVLARQVRAQLRGALDDGSVDLAEVLEMADGADEQAFFVARMKVVDLLTSYRGIGPTRARILMDRLKIAPTRRVGGLGPHQREGLVAALRARRGETGAAPEPPSAPTLPAPASQPPAANPPAGPRLPGAKPPGPQTSTRPRSLGATPIGPQAPRGARPPAQPAPAGARPPAPQASGAKPPGPQLPAAKSPTSLPPGHRPAGRPGAPLRPSSGQGTLP